MPGWARPVRIFCSSPLNASIERAIFCSAVFLMSAIVISHSSRGNAGPLPSFLDPLGGPGAKRQVRGQSYVNERALVLALDDALERARLEDREDADRQLLVAAERERGRVEHLQVLDDGLVEADARIARRARVLVRVGAV